MKISKNHKHIFIYPTPNGPISVGKCKCGAEQPGYNSLEGAFKFNNRYTSKAMRKKKLLNNFLKK